MPIMPKNNYFLHKKTGKPYSVVSDTFKVKINGEWINDMVLYKAEYSNPDGPYFARKRDDFMENFFVPVDRGNSITVCKWTFSQPVHPIIAPNWRFAPSPIQVKISDTGEFIGTIEDYAGKLDELFTKLTGKTEQQIQEFLDNYLEPCMLSKQRLN